MDLFTCSYVSTHPWSPAQTASLLRSISQTSHYPILKALCMQLIFAPNALGYSSECGVSPQSPFPKNKYSSHSLWTPGWGSVEGRQAEKLTGIQRGNWPKVKWPGQTWNPVPLTPRQHCYPMNYGCLPHRTPHPSVWPLLDTALTQLAATL